MSDGDETFRRLQAIARSASAQSGVATPTQEYLTRHLIESFLERLTRTVHNRDFVLKGGILLAAYGVRRPTRGPGRPRRVLPRPGLRPPPSVGTSAALSPASVTTF